MSRFGYLDGKKIKKAKEKRSDERARTLEGQKAEVVYVRRETIRAAWRELKEEGGAESLSELVDDLLLAWLRERQQRRGE